MSRVAVADLSHADTWLFDLDHTLYPVGSPFMARMVEVLTDFVAGVTGLPQGEASALWRRYVAEDGHTLAGLMRDYGVTRAQYYPLFHDFPMTGLGPDPALQAALARLPGRRLVYSNSDETYARQVLEGLGLTPLFDEVLHLDSFGFHPKPSLEAFRRMIAERGIAPAATVYCDDTERNLAPAAEVGMTTVLVGAQAAGSTASFVHYRAADLGAFLADCQTA